ncbi:MAG: sodium:solute symporter [Bacteroidetes bacterium]|nr:sodium:solute symporter [Bacteroidota bacterium]MBU1680211.1 sodium:solute symporter [Bacteroidota bacterium]MBU2507581.1 sodium:solute symporter [Bacteroidota bacterium]
MISNLSLYDNLIIILYFAVVLYIGLFLSKFKDKNTSDYFLAGRNLGWFAVGISLFATNISSEHIVGLAGAGYKGGIAVGQFEWMAVFIIIILGWFFAPVFIKSGVFTMPEFLGKRYDNRSRIYLTWISIFAYIFTKISITLFAGGMLLSEVLGWDMFNSAVLLVLVTGIYTVVGGMSSVVYTQIFQTIVLIAGALLLTIFGMNEIGGVSALTSKIPEDFYTIFKPMSDPDFPWTGIIFGAPILGIWYWCTDQYIVQRILSAKGIDSARKGTLLAAFLKVLPVFILLIPGLIALILYPDISPDQAFASLLNSDILPLGIKGVVIAGLFAAMMSSLASAFNSTAILFTLDIYKPRFPKSSESELVLVGRLSTVVMVLSAILWIPLLKLLSNQMYVHIQTMQAFISPPIACVFIFGLLWKRANSRGAFGALIGGGSIGLLRLILEWIQYPAIKDIVFFNWILSINYLHFAIFLFIFSSVILIALSLQEVKETTKENINEFFTVGELGLGINSTFNYTKSRLIRGDLFFSLFLILIVFSIWGILLF